VDLFLQSILVVASFCIEAATRPAVSCLPRDICYRWCLVVTWVVVADAQVGDDTAVSAFAVAEATTAKALADKGCLWFAVAPLALLFLARSTAA
jgi:hypothetical protein